MEVLAADDQLATEHSFTDVYSEDERKRIGKEFARLQDVCYLDHIGAAPYPSSIIEETNRDLLANLYSNPHSNSLSSKNTSDSIDIVRYKILQHFKTDVNDYSVIFTSGATAALKIVAESFVWKNDAEVETTNNCGDLVYLEDNHTSVLGMRDLVEKRGASTICMSFEESVKAFSLPELDNSCRDTNAQTNSLFVYSAQCNFSGTKYPLRWTEKVKQGFLNQYYGKASNWYCCLDAASFASTNDLNLSTIKPDFVCVSFYKIFGYPTGLGALLVRNTSSHLLEKNYYGGGTVLISLSSENMRVLRPVLHERFEDGTINFLSIISLRHGFNSIKRLYGSMEKVSRHCFNLGKYLYTSLLKLHHCNGQPAVKLYNDTSFVNIEVQGGVVNFNLKRSNGESIGYIEVLQMANVHGIQLRTGCFCNPGACKRHLGLTVNDLKRHFEKGHVCGDAIDLVDGEPTGSIRVSFGPYNTKKDADHLLEVIEKCFIDKPVLRFIPSNLKSKIELPQEKVPPVDLGYIYFWYENIGNLWPEYMELTDSTPSYARHAVNNGTSTTNCYVKKTKTVGSSLTHIFLYPIKSCGRLSVSQWQLESTGLKYDRLWMITNESGVAVTQKKDPKLCLIRPIIDLEKMLLVLNFRGKRSYELSLHPPINTRNTEVAPCQSKVCGDRIQGLDCGDGVADWLSEVLEKPGLRLIRQLPEDNRLNRKTSEPLSLTNQAQYLLINENSVKWLSDLLREDSECTKESMLDRFRSNFVVSGIPEFSEQTWSHGTIGNVNFKVDGPCGRCQMICINQATGELTKEPLTTLAASMKGKLKFGIYLSTETPLPCDSQISVGETVTFE